MKNLFRLSRLILSLLAAIVLVTVTPAAVASGEGQILHSDIVSGPPGTVVHITGTSFTPTLLPSSGSHNGTIMSYADIYFPDRETLVQSAVINTWGNIDTELTIPDITSGDYQIWVHDRTGGDLAWMSVPFTVVPDLKLSKTSGYTKDVISIAGKGFTPESNYRLYFNIHLVLYGMTDENGSFSVDEYMIPANAPVNNTLKASDYYGNVKEVSFTAQRQKVVAYPNICAPEKEISIEGSGFEPETEVTISLYDTLNAYFDITTNPDTVNTSASGNFTAFVRIPSCPAGDYIVEAFDGSARAGVSLEVTSSGIFNRSIGFVGSNVTFNGTGFPPRRYTVVSFDDIPLTEAKSDSQGAVGTWFTIPPCSPGQHVITITDGTVLQSYKFSILSKAKLELNRTFAHTGSTIQVNGTGFLSGKVAILSFDNQPVAEAPVDTTESFSAEFNVPSCETGTHVLTVSDGTNNLTRNLDIEGGQAPSAALSAPGLITPDQYTVTGSDVDLIWKGNDTAKEQLYTLQIAGDPTFSPDMMIAQKSDLNETSYVFRYAANTTSDMDVLPFFWRVKVQNQDDTTSSDWSEVRQFLLRPIGGTNSSSGSGTSLNSYSVLAEIGAILFLLVFWYIRRRRSLAPAEEPAS